MVQTKKCKDCHISLSYFRYYDYSMNRMYVKFENSWKSIGWICPRCLNHEFDNNIYIYLQRGSKRTVYVKFKKSWKRIGTFHRTFDKYKRIVRTFKLETKSWK